MTNKKVIDSNEVTKLLQDPILVRMTNKKVIDSNEVTKLLQDPILVRMTNKKVIDSNELTKLLQDSTIVRIVSILGNTSLSILELLEYNLTRKDVNYALSSGVIVIDKSSSSSQSHLDYPDVSLDDNNILVSGDYYFYNFLSSKVKLTDLGIYILETIKAENRTIDNEIPKEIEGPQQQYFSSHYPNVR